MVIRLDFGIALPIAKRSEKLEVPVSLFVLSVVTHLFWPFRSRLPSFDDQSSG
jgi:hypothetical protein